MKKLLTTQKDAIDEMAAKKDSGERPALFRPLTLKKVTLSNRIVNGPTSLFTCKGHDGMPTAFHMTHIGSHAIGGAGLIFTEAAAVSPEGRTSIDDLGFWSDDHGRAFEPIVQFAQSCGAKVGLQLFHGGRRCGTDRYTDKPLRMEDGGWVPLGPSAIASSPRYREPKEMTREDIAELVKAYGRAAYRANITGFDAVELHATHGYLLHQFHSLNSNKRTDEYGGSWRNRVRFTLEAAQCVRDNWPDEKPIFVRLSATEWLEDGWQVEDMIRLAKELESVGVDVINVSTGAGDKLEIEKATTQGYVLPFAEQVKKEVSLPVCTAGLITTPGLANDVIESGKADLVAIARPFMRDPYWGLRAAEALGCPEAAPWPREYSLGVAQLKNMGL